MIRRLAALVAAGVVVAVGLDRALGQRAAGRPSEPIRTFVVIDAPPGRVWEELVDIEGQPRWMREMKEVRLLTPPPVGVGTRGEALVRIFGIGVRDPVTVTEFQPPVRFAIRHEGLITGGGVIELEAGADGTSTIVRWAETLVPPLLPDLGSLVQRPILWRVFQDDLGRFRELLETGEPVPPPVAEGAGPGLRGAAALAGDGARAGQAAMALEG